MPAQYSKHETIMNKHQIERSRRHSYIGMFSSCNLSYSMQYQRAFEVLYESNSAVDTIALPMLYILRHCIELALKYNIEYFHDYSGSKNQVDKSIHKLIPLTLAFKEHWNIVKKKYQIKCEDNEYFGKLKILIEKVDKLDNTSTSFRYSHDIEKSKHFARTQKIDIFEIKTLYEEVCPLLYNTVDVFDHDTGLMNGNVTKNELLESH